MATEFDGYTEAEVDNGFRILFHAADERALEAAIDANRILEAPIFHALLRNRLAALRRGNGAIPIGVEARCDLFFEVLHRRAYGRLIEKCFGSGLARAAPGHRPPALPYLPAFFRRVVQLMGGLIPPVSGPSHQLPRDLDAFAGELASFVDRPANTPPYSSSEGSAWALLVVRCPACGTFRLRASAVLVNLVVDPSMAEPLRAGRINSDSCATCGCAVVEPMRVWATDTAAAQDPLVALTCAFVFSPSLLVFQPPPGTTRDTRIDRILEQRFERLCDETGVHAWLGSLPGSERPKAMVVGVAYNQTELVAYLTEAGAREPAAIPLSLRTLIADQANKIAAGFAPLGQTLSMMREMTSKVGHEWPLLPASQAEHGGWRSPYEAVIAAVIAEEVAKLKGADAGARILLAELTAQALRAVHENGMAEATHCEALRLLTEVSRDDPKRSMLEHAIRLGEAEQAQAMGDAERSYTARKSLTDRPVELRDEADSTLSRLQAEETRASLAHVTGRIKESLTTYIDILPAIERLAEPRPSEAASPAPEEVPRSARHLLSGALANWATLVLSLADHLEDLPVVCPGTTRAVGNVSRRRSSADDAELHAELDEALAVYFRWFPGKRTSARLRSDAIDLLGRALSLSVAVGGWGFAAVQTAHLLQLRAREGATIEATALAHQLIQYGARVGAHELIAHAHHYLGDEAMDRGSGAEALKHYRAATEEYMHFGASSGNSIGAVMGRAEQFAIGGMMTTATGGDPMEAFLTIETVKSLPTALALSRGMNSAAQGAAHDRGSALVSLRKAREELRLRLIWDRGALPEVRDELESVEQQIQRVEHEIEISDPSYLARCDAAGLTFPRAHDFVNRLRVLGTRAAFLGIYPESRGLWSYLIGADGSCSFRMTPWSSGRGSEPECEEGGDLDWAALVLEPHVEWLRRCSPDDRLIFSGHDALGSLPIAALMIDSQPLCLRVRISYIQSGEVLRIAATRPVPGARSIACFGNPERDDTEPLPRAEVEAVELCDLFLAAHRQGMVFTGRRATVRNVQTMAATSDVLHFACHAGGDLSASHLSRLLLAHDLAARDSGDLSDGRVLAELRLRPGCFVNLAACESGAVHDNVRALPRGLVGAFLFAGASAVMGSLWPVSDADAWRFQVEFYRRILDGESLVASLTSVQRACIAGSLGPEMRHESAWAAFVLYGGV